MEKLPWQNFLEEILKEKWSWCIYLAHIDCPWLLLDCFDVVALWNVRFHIFPYQHRVRIPDGSISMSDHKRGSDLFFSSKFTFWQGRWHFQCIGHCGHLHWGSQKSLRTTPGWRTWAPQVPPKIWTQQTVSYGTKITKTVTNWFVNMDDPADWPSPFCHPWTWRTVRWREPSSQHWPEPHCCVWAENDLNFDFDDPTMMKYDYGNMEIWW